MTSSNLKEKPLDGQELGVDSDGADVVTGSGPRLPKDRLSARLLAGLAASLLINAAIWTLVAQVVRTRISTELPPATFKRVILPPPPKPPKRPKIVHKIIPPKPKPVVVPKLVKIPTVPPPIRRSPVPPPAQHNHVLTATTPTPSSSATALLGGSAQPGKPIAQQASQEQSATTPPQPVQQQSQAPPPPPPPPVVPQPKPAPPPGPTQDAQPSNQVYPDIPDELKTDDYKSFVRVKVDIAADGSFTVSLVSSSGNEEIDERVLDALKHWKWSPALAAGTPIESTERFRFNFEIN